MDLKPCPFCGHSASMSLVNERDERRYFERTVSCDNCDAALSADINFRTFKDLSDSEASELLGCKVAAAWNRRT